MATPLFNLPLTLTGALCVMASPLRLSALSAVSRTATSASVHMAVRVVNNGTELP